MEFSAFLFLGILVSFVHTLKGAERMKDLPSCNYPAIYNFGDSNSDTGGIAAAFYPMAAPYGETYFHQPAGRGSDGRLIIDFIADYLGLPYLSSYLDSIGTSYQHGANFATGGATIMRPNKSWFENGESPFPLEIQVEHYSQFKVRTAYFYDQVKGDYSCSRLPRPVDFSKALFTLDIGQNDIAAAFRKKSTEFQQVTVPNIVSQFTAQVRELYKKGARTFWIHNTGPIGCLPVNTIKVQDPRPRYLDEHGCIESQNNMARQFNKHLKVEIGKLRTQLSEAAIIYVDMYTAKYELISNAKNEGFEDPSQICCGYHGVEYDVFCGSKGHLDGAEVFAGSCAKPSRVISWDGVHYTDAANHWIFKRIINGSLSDPSTTVTEACHMKMGHL